MGALTFEELSIGAPIQGATYHRSTPGGIRFAQTPRLLSGDAFSVITLLFGSTTIILLKPAHPLTST